MTVTSPTTVLRSVLATHPNRFLMSEVPLYIVRQDGEGVTSPTTVLRSVLATQPDRPSYGGPSRLAFFYNRGTPVHSRAGWGEVTSPTTVLRSVLATHPDRPSSDARFCVCFLPRRGKQGYAYTSLATDKLLYKLLYSPLATEK